MARLRTDEEHSAWMRKVQAAQAGKVAARTVEKGLLIVHTGPGKGKTSAALGMVARAVGHGMRVGVVQFIKGPMASGERVAFEAFGGLVEFKVMGEGFTWDTQDRARDVASARAAWEEVRRMVLDPGYRLVVADELNIVLRYGYLPVDEVLDTFSARPAMTHVVVTGRDALPALLDRADLVTEMVAVKHPFRDQGVKAQAGIEF